jgi:hypothetical protein
VVKKPFFTNEKRMHTGGKIRGKKGVVLDGFTGRKE